MKEQKKGMITKILEGLIVLSLIGIMLYAMFTALGEAFERQRQYEEKEAAEVRRLESIGLTKEKERELLKKKDHAEQYIRLFERLSDSERTLGTTIRLHDKDAGMTGYAMYEQYIKTQMELRDFASAEAAMQSVMREHPATYGKDEWVGRIARDFAIDGEYDRAVRVWEKWWKNFAEQAAGSYGQFLLTTKNDGLRHLPRAAEMLGDAMKILEKENRAGSQEYLLYAIALSNVRRFDDAKAYLRKAMESRAVDHAKSDRLMAQLLEEVCANAEAENAPGLEALSKKRRLLQSQYELWQAEQEKAQEDLQKETPLAIPKKSY